MSLELELEAARDAAQHLADLDGAGVVVEELGDVVGVVG